MVLAVVAMGVERWRSHRIRNQTLEWTSRELLRLLTQAYLVEACPRCLETQMELLEISPNARSIHYKCLHCGEKIRSPAGSAEANRSSEFWAVLNDGGGCTVTFITPAAPL